MKFSCNWLAELLGDLPPVSELNDLLTFAGVEVEGVETRGVKIEKVVVSRIIASEKHPDADRLSVCRVEDGSGSERPIVCGAKNYKPGDKVPLALPGAVLPGGIKIKSGKLRGIKSEGMLCSAAELGLSPHADGLLILDPNSPVGAPICDLFPSDTILELEITPNRPDLLSHQGLARDLAILLKRVPAFPKISEIPSGSGVPSMEVKIDSPDSCLLYSGRRISEVKIGPSPRWLVEKLESCGLRSINNVVDVTNFVLLETGQPLHAFDGAKLSGAIRARLARHGECFYVLDGQEIRLKENHLVIADDLRAQALAGVMGSSLSAVSGSTTEIVLEAALFDPATIRRTSRETGLASDSSYRFERGVDPCGVLAAERRATSLILELAGGRAGDPVIVKTAGFDAVANPREVVLRYSRCIDLLGYKVAPEEVRQLLAGLGLSLISTSGSGLETVYKWRIPSHRQDLQREVDMIEEICRLAGMHRIPKKTSGWYASGSDADDLYDFRLRVARTLAAAGFHETRTLALISESALADALPGLEAAMPLKNPMSSDHSHLRPSLVPGLIAVLDHNLRQGAGSIRLFEIGSVFSQDGQEHEQLALLVSGKTPSNLRQPSPEGSEFFDLKGALELLGIPGLRLSRKTSPLPLDLEVRSGDLFLGRIAALPSSRAKVLGARGAVFVAELGFEDLRSVLRGAKSYNPLPKFPAIVRDVAFVANTALRHEQVVEILTGAGEVRLESIHLFDLFEDPAGTRIPKGKKSMAYSLTYRAADRTLTDDEVAAAHGALVARLEGELGVQIRG